MSHLIHNPNEAQAAMIARAGRVAKQLEAGDSLHYVATEDELDNPVFCSYLDSLVFECHVCNQWFPQRENATPDAAEWTCRECL